MNWEKDTEEKFKKIVDKVPMFLREMAKTKVATKAEKLAEAAGRGAVSEKDLVDAFFSETPFGFHGPLKCDLEALGVDYVKYGHPR